MLIRGTTRLLGILGNPLSHSYSPSMHNMAIERLKLDLVYVPLKVETSGLDACLRAIRELDFLGVNVTVPHKQAVIPHLDEISDISRLMGAVNTIVKREGKLLGTTTDPEGFLAGFREAGCDFDGKSISILGNGGAARTLVFTLFTLAKPKHVAVAARACDASMSEILAREIRDKLDRKLEIMELADYPRHGSRFDVLVNTTPVGMYPRTGESPLPPEALNPGQIVYDLIYNPGETALMRHARERGCKTIGGLSMLVHQGVASFKLWTGLDPDPALYYEGVRRQMGVS
jgi:shikimate dehydrogenase